MTPQMARAHADMWRSEVQQARAALDALESYAIGRGDDEGARSFAKCIRKILVDILSGPTASPAERPALPPEDQEAASHGAHTEAEPSAAISAINSVFWFDLRQMLEPDSPTFNQAVRDAAMRCVALGNSMSGILRYAQETAAQAAAFYGPPKGWAALDDVYGCLMQIDNALTGLQRRPCEHVWFDGQGGCANCGAPEEAASPESLGVSQDDQDPASWKADAAELFLKLQAAEAERDEARAYQTANYNDATQLGARLEASQAEVARLREGLRGAVEDLEQTLRWRGEGWECSEAELLGGYRALLNTEETR